MAKKPSKDIFTFEAQVQRVKDLIAKNTSNLETQDKEKVKEYHEVTNLIKLYLDNLSDYLYEEHTFYKLEYGSPNYNNWKTVLDKINKLQVTKEQFIKSFFWYYNKHNLGIPKVKDFRRNKGPLVAETVLTSYLRAERQGAISVCTPIGGRVLPSPEVNTSSFLKLKQLMDTFKKSEEEILLIYAREGVREMYFDTNWLKTRPTFLKLEQEGRL